MGMILNKVQTINNTYDFEHVYYQIANYIMCHLDNIDSMTLASLASQSYTSRSSVLKFCSEMGFESWKIFISHLANEIENRKALNQIFKMNTRMSNDLENGQLGISKVQMHYFEEYYESISADIFQRISQSIREAQRILICGEDNVCLCLREFQTFLSFQGKEVHIRSMVNKKEINSIINQFDNNDLIFIITPTESFESLLESHEFDEIIQFKQLMNRPIKKVFIGQKSIFNIKYMGCEIISIPYTTDYYLFLFIIIDFVYKLNHYYVKSE